MALARWEGESSSLFQTAHFDLFQRRDFLNKISTDKGFYVFYFFFN